eukprot:1604066-Pyramimonas_sp.AAC.2
MLYYYDALFSFLTTRCTCFEDVESIRPHIPTHAAHSHSLTRVVLRLNPLCAGSRSSVDVKGYDANVKGYCVDVKGYSAGSRSTGQSVVYLLRPLTLKLTLTLKTNTSPCPPSAVGHFDEHSSPLAAGI